MSGFISSPGVALFLLCFGLVLAAILFAGRRPVIYPATVEIRPGDVVLFHCDDLLTHEQVAAIRRAWHHARQTDGVVVLHSGLRVSIVGNARQHGARAEVVGG